MVEDVEMEVTPLVKALTRTPTLFGVPYMYSMFNMVVTGHLGLRLWVEQFQ
jgi:type IV secretion system protein VirB3